MRLRQHKKKIKIMKKFLNTKTGKFAFNVIAMPTILVVATAGAFFLWLAAEKS